MGKQVGRPLTVHEEHVRGVLLLLDGKHALSWSGTGRCGSGNLKHPRSFRASMLRRLLLPWLIAD